MSYIGGCITLVFTSILAGMAGIGGGGVNVPVFLLVFGYSYDTAIKRSLYVVFGCLCSQLLLNYNARHPDDETRPAIYYDIILILLPAQIGGAKIGDILAKVLPGTIEYILSVLLLLFAATKTGIKLLSIRQRELDLMHSTSEKLQLNPQSDSAVTRETYTRKMRESFEGDEWDCTRFTGSFALGEDDIITQVRDQIRESVVGITMEDDKPKQKPPLTVPTFQLASLMTVWVFYLVISIVLTFLGRCSPGYWSLKTLNYPVLFAFIWWTTMRIDKSQRDGTTILLNGDFSIRENSRIFGPVLAFIIGVLCSVLGIGGGELMGPALVTLQIRPEIIAPTTALMSLFNSSSSAVTYTVQGAVGGPTAALLWGIGAFGGFVGRLIGIIVAKRLRRPSFTILILTILLSVSAICDIYATARSDPDWSFHSACKSGR